jgi:hypothetical protein
VTDVGVKPDVRLLLASLNLKLNARDTRLLLARLELNPRIVENAYWFLPVVDDGHSDMVQAGRGVVSSELCGEFRGRRVCHDKEHHKGVVYKDVDFTGMNVVMNTYYHCHKVLCVVCFASGFAVREAQVFESRIAEAVERGFGVPEHIVLSPPRSLWDLPFSELFELSYVVLRDRGVTAVGLIPHGRRIDRKARNLFWSPHIHGIGFILGGFDVCRNCVHKRGDCEFCLKGFKGRQVRGYKKDKWIVKVEPKRKSIFGTAVYLLNHCTVKVGLKRFHSVRWFGLLGNRVFRAVNSKRSAGCPVCKVAGHYSEMEREAYWGSKRLSGSGCNAVPDFDGDGKSNFPSSVGGG